MIGCGSSDETGWSRVGAMASAKERSRYGGLISMCSSYQYLVGRPD
jgi:hypothetical protein